MIAVTNVTIVMIVTNVIKKFESLQRGLVETDPLCNNQELIYTIPKHNGERIVHRRETRHCFLYSCGFRIG